jgi:hypothetical protein
LLTLAAADPAVWTWSHVETVELLQSTPRRVLVTMGQYIGYSHSRALALVAPSLQALPDTFCIGGDGRLVSHRDNTRPLPAEGVQVLSSGPEDLLLQREASSLPDTLALLQVWYPFHAPADSTLVRWVLEDGRYIPVPEG